MASSWHLTCKGWPTQLYILIFWHQTRFSPLFYSHVFLFQPSPTYFFKIYYHLHRVNMPWASFSTFRHITDTVFVTWLTVHELIIQATLKWFLWVLFIHINISAWQQNSAYGLCVATDTWCHGCIHKWSTVARCSINKSSSLMILFIIDL